MGRACSACDVCRFGMLQEAPLQIDDPRVAAAVATVTNPLSDICTSSFGAKKAILFVWRLPRLRARLAPSSPRVLILR